ncbi:MAG: lysoplasmalogenase [Acidimicrobiia bacterium]
MTGAAFLLLALAQVAALADWIAVQRRSKPLEYLCKPLVVVLLVGAALALDPADATARGWFVAALALCLVGDVCLMLPRDLFVAGLVAFLAGHLAYVVGFHAQGIDAARFAVGVALVVAVGLVVGRRILRGARAGPDPALAGPVVAYLCVISAMVASAVGAGGILAVAGALLFYASDGLIAEDRFVGPVRHGPLLVIVTYHLAQMALVTSLV